MKNFHSLSLLFLSSFFLVVSSSNSMSLLHLSLSPSQTQKRCLDDQKSALLQLQQELRYAPAFTISSKAKLWDANNSDCCSWNRVSCDDTGHVIGLDLSYNNLSGSFHSVFKLHHLRSLSLAGNYFNTTLFQYDFDRLSNFPEIQNLKSLKVLNLSRNSFSGRIPLALENLKKLESLDLSNNKLLGKIPPQLTSLTFLAVLNLSYNQLEGIIPQGYQFSTFSNDSYRGNPKLCGPPLTRKCNDKLIF